MEDGFVTWLPLGQDQLNVTRNMDTTSLATTFPFVSSDLSDDKGIMYGINIHNGSLVIFDRFSMPNYNSVVFAMAGAGKSYMIKLEVLRSLMLGTEIIVVDPENEYRDLAAAVGGQYIAFGYGEASKINPFDLSLVEEEGENALNSKILSVHKLLKVMLGNMDPIEESILDKAMMDAYKMKGITPDPTTQNREPPLIEDLYKSLIGMEEEKAKSLAARLEKYIKGSFAGIFNQKTTVNLTNPFVVFGIKNLEDTLRPVAMHIILDYIWTIVKKTLKKRILVVDEAWYLMQYEDSASFLRGIVKRGRKYYLGVTTITQDVDDFLATPYGKEIVTNSAIQILLKQHTAAIDQIGKVFYLSEGEKQLLLTADKGQGIFFAGQNHVAINIISSEEEHQLITSNPEDVLKKQPIVKFNQEKLKEIEKPVIDTAVVVENKEVIVVNKEPEIIQPQETTNDVLQRKIGELEEKEKQDLINYNEIPKELSGEIPIKNQDLPPLPKFEPPKAEVITTEDNKKPIFIKTEETQISQPPQLNKKTQPVFETTKSPIPAELPSLDSLSLKTTDEKINGDQKNTEEIKKPEDTNKMDYDKLFGNGIV
jgi:phosphotransferase system IIA component